MKKIWLLTFTFVLISQFLLSKASAQSCMELFVSNETPETADARKLTGKSPIDQLFIKEELEILFLFRERLSEEGLKEKWYKIRKSDAVLRKLIERITGKMPEVGQKYTPQQYEDAVLLPAFRGLALDLAYQTHKKYPGVDLADLQQAALLGLIKGIRAYSSESLYMLSTISRNFILSEINATLSDLRYPVAFSGSDYSLLSRLARIQVELKRSLNREPTFQEIVDENNRTYAPITVGRVAGILKWKNFVTAIDSNLQVREITDGHEEFRDVDPISRMTDSKPTPEQQVYFQQLQNRLGFLMEKAAISLGMKAKAFSLNHGFSIDKRSDGNYKIVLFDPLTMEEISGGILRQSLATELNADDRQTVSRGRISLMIAEAKSKIRKYIKSMGGKDTDDLASLFETLLVLYKE